jgi:hypothetical protein
MSSSTDPLADLIRQLHIGWWIAATILAVFCGWWIAFRRMTGMQMQINQLRSDVNALQGQNSGWFVRALSPKSRSRKAPKWSNPSPDTLQETSSSASEQPVNESAPHGVASKNIFRTIDGG